MTKVNQFQWVPKPDALDKAAAWLQPNCRFSLDDVVELPDLVSRTIDIDMTPRQADIYKKLAREFKADIGNGTVTAVNAAVAMGKLLQVAGGWVYAGTAGAVPCFKPEEDMHRHNMLLELVEENERKVIIYVPYVHALAGVSKLLTDAKVEHCVVHGQTANRGDLFNAFQNTTKYKVLVAHPQCVAHGLTLTAADTIIWYLPHTSLEITDQANARITRVGQKHKQKIFHLQSTPVEKKIYKLLARKQSVQSSLLGMLEDAMGEG